MLQIHPNARTTPAVRAEIAPSSERSGVLAARYGVSAETVRKWRRRGLGFVHIDAKQLPKLCTADGQVRQRYLFVAIDRCSRSVHLAVKDDLTQQSGIAFLREAVAAFPFRITTVLTDRGCSFASVFSAACKRLGIEHRRTRAYTPQTNGMTERYLRAHPARGAVHHGG